MVRNVYCLNESMGEHRAIEVGLNKDSYTQEWLKSSASAEGARARSRCENEDELATRLYQQCIIIMKGLCRQSYRQGPTFSLWQNAIGSLYLWGEPFQNGKLDTALSQSDDLRNTILDLLGDIGDMLLGQEDIGMWFWILLKILERLANIGTRH